MVPMTQDVPTSVVNVTTLNRVTKSQETVAAVVRSGTFQRENAT